MKIKNNRKKIIISVIFITILCFVSCMTPKFGRAPKGEILEKIEASPNYSDGKFQNYSPRIKREGSSFKGWWNFLFGKRVEGFKPSEPLPSVKTNLKELDIKKDVLVWLGHSSMFIQVDGVRFLVDPILISGSPVFFVNRPFKGTEIYKPDDIPDIDYLLISHEHWDHLDYKAIKKMKNRIGKVVCGLGVGEHFRKWKFNPADIIELDWYESVALKENITLHILPTRHYSGRASFGADKTLWVGFMIEASSNIYISGDTGYDRHFNEIGQRFQAIDLAIIEFGQYGYNWRDIHIMPNEIAPTIKDLNPKRSFLSHNSKFGLGRHPWKEPLEIAAKLIKEDNFNIITPMLGELVYLKDTMQSFTKWWERVE